MGVKHPAKFSDPILERIGDLLDYHGWPHRVLDPFAGTGRVHDLGVDPDFDLPWRPQTVGVEIEPEWASLHAGTIVADTLALPFADATFDGMVTSPCYGNRLADAHNAQDGSIRHSYTHDIGRKLHPNNSGQFQWGPKYWEFHDAAWSECLRVLGPDALVIVNVSNHIRGGVEQLVTEWHLQWFLAHNCRILDLDRVCTQRLRHGANREARARYENLLVLRYTPEEPT